MKKSKQLYSPNSPVPFYYVFSGAFPENKEDMVKELSKMIKRCSKDIAENLLKEELVSFFRDFNKKKVPDTVLGVYLLRSKGEKRK